MKWFIACLLGLGLLWYFLNQYMTEQRIQASAPVRRAQALQKMPQKAQEAADRYQSAVGKRTQESEHAE